MNGDEYIRTIADLLPGELYRIKITGFLKGKKTFPLSLYRMTGKLILVAYLFSFTSYFTFYIKEKQFFNAFVFYSVSVRPKKLCF